MEIALDPEEISWKDYYTDIFTEKPPSPEMMDSYYEVKLFIDCNLSEILLKTNLHSTEIVGQNLFIAMRLFLTDRKEPLFKAGCMATSAVLGELRFTHDF